METPYPVGEAELAAWCDAWNDDDTRLLPLAPADLAHEAATLGVVERFAVGPHARPAAVGAVRRHFAFRQDTRVALDLHVRPEARRRGLGGLLLEHLLARARSLGADVIRTYAPEGDRGWKLIKQFRVPTPASLSVPWRPRHPGASAEPGGSTARSTRISIRVRRTCRRRSRPGARECSPPRAAVPERCS